MSEINSYFIELNSIDVSDYVETKGGAVKLNYLSWAYAWGEIKKRYPLANYTVYENKDGWNYFTDGRTAWVKTGVTINGLEHIEYCFFNLFSYQCLALFRRFLAAVTFC